MKLFLRKDGKTVDFLEDSASINQNDDLAPVFDVLPEIPLDTSKETLLVTYNSEDGIQSSYKTTLLNRSDGHCSADIPTNLVRLGGTWAFQIFRQRSIGTAGGYKETASNKYYITIGEGVKNPQGQVVTTAMLTTLYRESTVNREKAEEAKIEAEQYANNADAAQTNAALSASAAKISESNAKASETVAQESQITATEAAATAMNSAEDAINAMNAAQASKEAAETAKISAEDASARAISAWKSAEASKMSAISAAERAGTAKTDAETARDNARSSATSASDSAASAAMSAKTAKDAENYVSTSIRDVAMAKSFDNYGSLVTHLQTAVLEIPYAEGQPFYIIETDVPDLWVSGYDASTNHSYSYSSSSQFLKDMDNNGGKLWVGNYQLSKLETAKVYLGDLQKQTDNRLQTSSKDVVTAINEVRQTANTASSKATAIENAKGKAGGYASLGNDGKVLENQLPDLNYQPATDNRLTTENKETYKAINELDGRLDNIGETIEEKVEPTTEKVEVIETELEQSKMLTTETVESAYDSRITANGKNVLNGSKAVLKKVKGATVDGVNATFGGIRSKSKNIFYPLKDRTEISTVGIGDISALEFSETAYYKGLSGGQYIDSNAVKEASIDGDSLTFMSTRDYYGIAFFVPVLGGQDVTIFWSSPHTNYRVSVTQFGDDKSITKGQSVTDGQYSSMLVHTEETTAWLMLVIQPNYQSNYQVITISKIQVEYGSMATDYAPYGVSNILFPKIELPALKTIDFERQAIIDYSQSPILVTPFTEEQLAMSNKYQVWSGGTETVLDNDGASSGVYPTLTQSYTVVNEIGSGGGLTESEVKAIVNSSITGKQDKLAFDGTYNASINKVATVQTVVEKISQIVAGADTSFDTLKEISDWIKAHPEDVSALNTLIQANAGKIAEHEATIGTNTQDIGDLKTAVGTLNDGLEEVLGV